MEKLFDTWAKRNPEWETRFDESIIKTYTDYGKGSTSFQEARGKIFGAGYEMIIVAFFIGLYYNNKRPLVEDSTKRKTLGQPIQYWGNVESRFGRSSYSQIKEYIFTALVARTDFDFIALDKDDVKLNRAVDALMNTMEEYINFGLHFIEEKMQDYPDYYFKETAFLRTFLDFIKPKEDNSETLDDEPESLD